MSAIDHWLLPEGVDELLPPAALRLERLRRGMLDLYTAWGYELIMPPVIEYRESLLTGTGRDLELASFNLTDQLTGRLMAVRADHTPQAARIDAHQLKHAGPTRLCYLGTVLHTRPDGFGGSRSPFQVGAELFGHAGIEADLEILELMLETLAVAGIADGVVDLGHVGIYRGLAAAAGIEGEAGQALFSALQSKAPQEIAAALAAIDADAGIKEALARLAHLHGGSEVFERVTAGLVGAPTGVLAAVDQLRGFGEELTRRRPGLALHYDLAELRGYAYQTGLVFAAYTEGCGQELARGGRYDQIGEAFGRARAATGFSTDLKQLMALGAAELEAPGRIAAPAGSDPGLLEAVRRLRGQGRCVVSGLPGAEPPAHCSHRLECRDGDWVVIPT